MQEEIQNISFLFCAVACEVSRAERFLQTVAARVAVDVDYLAREVKIRDYLRFHRGRIYLFDVYSAGGDYGFLDGTGPRYRQRYRLEKVHESVTFFLGDRIGLFVYVDA